VLLISHSALLPPPPFPRFGHGDDTTRSEEQKYFLFFATFLANNENIHPSQRNRKRRLKRIFRTVRVALIAAPVPVAYNPLFATRLKLYTFLKNTSSFETLGSKLCIPNMSVEYFEFVFYFCGGPGLKLDHEIDRTDRSFMVFLSPFRHVYTP
jgi:hypothetical protein